DELLRAAIEGNGGYVFKTVGDAFYATFVTAPQALNAALAAQRAILSESWAPEIGGLKIRVALHTGVADVRDRDYFCPPLNRVTRILGAGSGGQTLLSQVSHDLVRDHPPQGVSFRDLGEHRLKDLARAERIFQVLTADLPTDFPALKTLDSRPNNL